MFLGDYCMSDLKLVKKCPECKSDNLIITQDLNGIIYAMTCLKCDWSVESEEYKKITNHVSDMIANFDRQDFLQSERGL